MNKFEVASIHLFQDCNMNCSFCYRSHETGNEKDLQFWLDTIPYFKKLGIPQVAAGGGEPLMRPKWVKELSKKCKKEGIYFNITTNGKLIQDVPLDTFENVSMVSISYDSEKIKTWVDEKKFGYNIKYLKYHFPKLKIGVNYLCDEKGLKWLSQNVFEFLNILEVNRVFALCPKNIPQDILSKRNIYLYLTHQYKNFMVDDLTKSIIEGNKYSNWDTPCHYGKILSMDEQGNIGGCSFDLGIVEKLNLKVPKDIMKVKDMKFEERTTCPYLKEMN